jgi:hypothetical protein
VESVAGVSAAEEGDGEVVVVVLGGWVGGGSLAEERDGVFALAAESDGLVVDDFRQRKAGGDEGEGLLGAGVVGGVEAGEAEVEIGLEREAVGGGYAGEGGGGGGEVAGGVLLFAECQQGVGVVGR